MSKKKNLVARQGDIGFILDAKRPKVLKPYDSNILAYGEVTGHCHEITSQPSVDNYDILVDPETGDLWMKPHKPVTIKHDEHGTITLDPGKEYCVTRQREYDPIAENRERKVVD